MKRKILSLALITSLCLLSACKTDTVLTKPIDSLSGMRDKKEARLSTAAAEAMAAGKTGEALAKYAKLHSHKPGDKAVAVNYAQLLRKAGDPARAVEVLRPFIEWNRSKGTRENADPLVKNEYAAAHIALGDFETADKVLNEVLEDEKAKDYHNDAQNLMGIALDARGQHREAEQMFRLALDGWKGDPSSVMNNLGLCLAASGKFDESLMTLRKALVIAPKKDEIARNIEIVTSLRDKVVKKPVPLTKAKAKKKKKS